MTKNGVVPVRGLQHLHFEQEKEIIRLKHRKISKRSDKSKHSLYNEQVEGIDYSSKNTWHKQLYSDQTPKQK